MKEKQAGAPVRELENRTVSEELGALWTPNGGIESPLASSLLQAADSWLRLHQVDHPDFLFFSRSW
ncbi:hypothetical protein HS088_TW07G00829 [Tripterygium wilfordii]|uniref:Uncharacterized protein n=1 Tax=Tripterygium wilfordii TaxID=458696 RepID=A0A7J7DGR5_TRIWF|nr:hypothetical protein HS088_TW07G00829 [Tripterygium wilfordii]